MRRAWLALLLNCGYPPLPSVGPGSDATIDASTPDATADSDLTGPTCWSIDGQRPHANACAASLVGLIDLSTDATLDTSIGASNQPLECAQLAAGGTDDVCALAAKTIRIRDGATLSAHGGRPFALLAHTIEIQGKIDVAGHLRGAQGPGANPALCNTAGSLSAPTTEGGGQGGTYNNTGGNGGNSGAGMGGHAGDASALAELVGGCPGWAGAGIPGPEGAGGPGGGALWIAVDTGVLTIGATASINASGGGGQGGLHLMGMRGGYGGGAGGMIVLQATTLTLDPGASIFANGGHGGGGGGFIGDGGDGTDPTGPTSPGGGGTPGTSNSGRSGVGGAGFPQLPTGSDGGNADLANGGGGGGGGPGVVLLFPFRTLPGLSNISPPLSSP
jgi:hypothetical protein